MNAIRFKTTVDAAVAGALPKLRPMLGRQVELIALAPEPATSEQRITLDDLLAHRLRRPEGVASVTLEDMDLAIARGALGGDP